MSLSPASTRAGRAGRRSWRLGLSRCLLALAMALPGAAHPHNLTQLLSLPLEELLRLQIAAAVPAWSAPAVSRSALPAPSERSKP
jgi:hypothetical protein